MIRFFLDCLPTNNLIDRPDIQNFFSLSLFLPIYIHLQGVTRNQSQQNNKLNLRIFFVLIHMPNIHLSLSLSYPPKTHTKFDPRLVS